MPYFTDTLYRSHVHRAVPSERRAPAENRISRPLVRRTPTQKEISELAYSLWEARGRQHGSALEDWLRAERQLMQPPER